jgi:hypothetical protein
MIFKANVENIYPSLPCRRAFSFMSYMMLVTTSSNSFHPISENRIDPDIFRATWEELVGCHDVLSTIFVHKDVPRAADRSEAMAGSLLCC